MNVRHADLKARRLGVALRQWSRSGHRVRRGYSLIELVIVMGLTSGVMGVIGVTMHLLMKTERQAQADETWLRSLRDLEIQFRRDVFAATSADLAPEELTLQQSDRTTVHYRKRPNRLERQALDSNGRVIHTERFELAGTEVEWRADDASAGARYHLTLRRPSRPANAATPFGRSDWTGIVSASAAHASTPGPADGERSTDVSRP